MRYPLPSQVGAYGSREQFDACRVEDGQWVFWEDRAALVLSGRYSEVKPLHVELSPTYLCNFACPWCSCRSAREEWSDVDIFNRPDASDTTVAPHQRLMTIIDRLAVEKIDIQWVGGEPTMHPAFYEACTRAGHAGLRQCLFTNGSLLHPKRLDVMLDANFAFVRFSLDAVSDEVHQRHHGYAARRNYAERVRRNIGAFCEAKAQRQGCETQLAISLVVDDVNIDDLERCVAFVEGVCATHGASAISYIIARPAYTFLGSQVELSPVTSERLRRAFAPGERLRKRLEAAGVQVVTPPASFKGADDRADLLEADDRCLSCGWFSEIAPSGDMSVCSDRYGAPEFWIGNLEGHDIASLWEGKQRKEVLEHVVASKCLKTYCPGNGRGRHLNRVFHQIEAFRSAGAIGVVRQWMADLRAVLPRPSHSFFL